MADTGAARHAILTGAASQTRRAGILDTGAAVAARPLTVAGVLRTAGAGAAGFCRGCAADEAIVTGAVGAGGAGTAIAGAWRRRAVVLSLAGAGSTRCTWFVLAADEAIVTSALDAALAVATLAGAGRRSAIVFLLARARTTRRAWVIRTADEAGSARILDAALAMAAWALTTAVVFGAAGAGAAGLCRSCATDEAIITGAVGAGSTVATFAGTWGRCAVVLGLAGAGAAGRARIVLTADEAVVTGAFDAAIAVAAFTGAAAGILRPAGAGTAWGVGVRAADQAIVAGAIGARGAIASLAGAGGLLGRRGAGRDSGGGRLVWKRARAGRLRGQADAGSTHAIGGGTADEPLGVAGILCTGRAAAAGMQFGAEEDITAEDFRSTGKDVRSVGFNPGIFLLSRGDGSRLIEKRRDRQDLAITRVDEVVFDKSRI